MTDSTTTIIAELPPCHCGRSGAASAPPRTARFASTVRAVRDGQVFMARKAALLDELLCDGWQDNEKNPPEWPMMLIRHDEATRNGGATP
jgi:hypothetical protein